MTTWPSVLAVPHARGLARLDAAVETVGPDPAPERLSAGRFDAVVVDHDAGVEPAAVEALRAAASAVPVLSVTDAPDGATAAAATRAGADEYVALAELPDGTTLVDRVRALARDSRADGPAGVPAGDTGSSDGVPAGDTDSSDGVPAGDTDSSDGVPAGDGAGPVGFRTDDGTAVVEMVADSVADGVVTVDESGTIVYANDGLAELTGHERDALVGAPLTTIMPDRFVDRHEAAFERYLATGERTIEWDSIELVVERPGGEELPVAVSFGEFEDGDTTYMTGALRDVSERAARERELERAERRFEALFDQPLGLVGLLGPDGRVRRVNEVARAALDGDPDDVVGVPFHETPWWDHPDSDRETVRELVAAAGDGEHGSFTGAYSAGDGRRVVDANVHPVVDDDGDVESIVVSGRDVTDRERREETLTGLLETTRELVTAPDADAVAATVSAAVTDLLGVALNTVRLYDPETHTLRPAATSDRVDELLPDRPVYDADEGTAAEAFRTGESIEGTTEGARRTGPAQSALYVPLGEYGVVTLATVEPGGFSDEQRRLAELLATVGTAALERADREAELRGYRAVVENARELMYTVDGAGAVTMATGPLAERLGRDREALVGRPVGGLLADGLDRHRTAVDLLQSGYADRETVEAALATADGEAIPVEVELSRLPGGDDACVAVVRDISRLEATRRELATQSERFEYLFENLDDAVVEVEFVDGEPLVRSANDAFESTFGIDVDAVRGGNLDDRFVPDGERDDAAALSERVVAEGSTTQEVRRRTPDGVRTFLFRGVAYDVDDRTFGLGIYTDITDQQERQRRLAVLQTLLRHNLRTEMTLIGGYAEQLGDRLDPPPAEVERLRERVDAVSRLSDRVGELQRTLENDDAAPTDVVEEVGRALFGLDHGEDDADLVVDLPASATAVADERLALVVEELVDNAVRHGDRERPRVEVSVTERPDAVELRVGDDGPGIPARERELLAGEREVTQLEHGSGLGLWLVAWVVRSYGGTVEFDERDPRGTVVTVTLPRPDA